MVAIKYYQITSEIWWVILECLVSELNLKVIKFQTD